ncbi:MAG: hypothetical protein JW704_02850 [Anaerolineaceae bacterium]|nr:hypothetical protein [Anaerolineaceae bacterium]
MKSITKMSQIELGAFVQTYLRQKGIEAVLSGGAAVSYYTKNQYLSKDLDLIRTGLTSRRELKKALSELGFIEQSRYFKHPLSEFIIEFPEGPLSVGKEPVTLKKTITVRMPTGILRILSPTDCVKDRLASYYYYNDHQCLNQAIMVAKSNQIDLHEIQRWSANEGELAKLKIFQQRLSS